MLEASKVLYFWYHTTREGRDIIRDYYKIYYKGYPKVNLRYPLKYPLKFPYSYTPAISFNEHI